MSLQDIIDSLNDEFESADELAEHIRSQGVVGTDSSYNCALSKFLTMEMGTRVVCPSQQFVEDDEGAVPLSGSTQEFVVRCDAGYYPALISHESHDIFE